MNLTGLFMYYEHFYRTSSEKAKDMTSSQWACIAVEADEIVEAIKSEARERQLSNLKKGDEKPDMELIPERETSSQKIADLFNTNEKYVREAGKHKTESPEIFQAVKNGEKNWRYDRNYFLK